MTLSFHRFDPADCGFPRPRVPVLPPLSRAQLGPARPAPATPRQHYARGRYALHAAYTLSGVGPGGALLAPAYHCRTMLDPALRLGAEVALYPLTPELHADVDGLARAAAACRTPPAAVLLTHYFGLPRATEGVLAWCQAHNVPLIEDCSHALPAVDPDGTLGRVGRWAVSSPYKFYPCPDGGWLWANAGAPLPTSPGRSQGLAAELRGLRSAWQQLRGTPAAPDAGAIEAELSALATRIERRGRDWIEHGGGLAGEYLAADEAATGLAISRWIERHTDLGPLAQRRRRRYLQWREAVDGVAGISALLPALPAGVVPYMFPLQVSEPARLFHPLKQLGVPIWRWDDMAVSPCPVAQRYRQGVFHLPCHQGLSDAQMAWLTAAVRRVATAH